MIMCVSYFLKSNTCLYFKHQVFRQKIVLKMNYPHVGFSLCLFFWEKLKIKCAAPVGAAK